jgi:hypothetical protein
MVSINDDPPPMFPDEDDDNGGPVKKISATSGCPYSGPLSLSYRPSAFKIIFCSFFHF